ncbi:MAG TPA: MBL fold metallo-hydrolase [Steroidobacteraceae bacterium]
MNGSPLLRAPAGPWRRLRQLLRSLRGGPGYQGAPSDHFDGQRFFNPHAPAGRSFADFLRWQRTRQARAWPESIANRARPSLPASLAPGQLALTFINHVTFLLQFRALHILTDPVYSERASPLRSLGPRRVRPPGLAFEHLPRIDLVLVSHNHYDHLDLDTLIALQAGHAPHFITTLGNAAFLRNCGLRSVAELDWWQSLAIGPGATVIATPAQHWSSRLPRNRNRTLWGGFVLRADGRQVYFAGDTGYAELFGQIRQRLGRIDLALLPIGAYEPRWFMRDQHMNPQDAVRAHLDLQATLSIGTHFGCFRLTDEGLDDPPRALAEARDRHNVAADAFGVLETGETRLFGGPDGQLRAQ